MQAMLNELKDILKTKEEFNEMPDPFVLKCAINNFLWSNLPLGITLGDADDLALALLRIIEQLHEGKTIEEIANRK